MGPRHSKRSLDMAGTPTKSEIVGVGNVGKLEKIDGIVEKVSANGHVDGEFQNGAEPLQNGMEPVQNGESAAVSVEHSMEKIKLDEKEEIAPGVNGEVDEKVNGEVDDKTGDAEGKEDKKDKKKEKKEKVVKKKFSFRSFSFSKKDKSKPKEEKTPDTKDKTGIEECPEVVENKSEENVEESKEAIAEPEAKVSEPEVEVVVNEAEKENAIAPPSPILVMTVDATVTETGIPEISDVKPAEKIANADDLPPPLPASPPPTEIKEEAPVETKEGEIEVTGNVNSVTSIKEVESFTEVMEAESSNEVLTTAEHIEEKATDLLKAVEEKVEECKRNDSEISMDDTNYDMNDDVEVNVSSASDVVLNDDAGSTVLQEVGSKLEESVPEAVSSIVTLSSNAEEATDKSPRSPRRKIRINLGRRGPTIPVYPLRTPNLKSAKYQEEFGAGESLAEIDGNAETALNANEVMVSD